MSLHVAPKSFIPLTNKEAERIARQIGDEAIQSTRDSFRYGIPRQFASNVAEDAGKATSKIPFLRKLAVPAALVAMAGVIIGKVISKVVDKVKSNKQ